MFLIMDMSMVLIINSKNPAANLIICYMHFQSPFIIFIYFNI